MVNVTKAAREIAKLSMLKFFPADKEARGAIVQMACEMATCDEQIEWLVRRVLGLYNEWPGPHELRACFCSKFRPADGINAYSRIYGDGIPSEKASAPQLATGTPRMIEAPKEEPISDPRVQRAVKRLAASMPKMPSGKSIGGRFEKQLREIETAPSDREPLPGPTSQIITRADVDRAVAELHRKNGVAQ